MAWINYDVKIDFDVPEEMGMLNGYAPVSFDELKENNKNYRRQLGIVPVELTSRTA